MAGSCQDEKNCNCPETKNTKTASVKVDLPENNRVQPQRPSHLVEINNKNQFIYLGNVYQNAKDLENTLKTEQNEITAISMAVDPDSKSRSMIDFMDICKNHQWKLVLKTKN